MVNENELKSIGERNLIGENVLPVDAQIQMFRGTSVKLDAQQSTKALLLGGNVNVKELLTGRLLIAGNPKATRA